MKKIRSKTSIAEAIPPARRVGASSLHVMKTLTPTEARKNLSAILERAMIGEDIGILHHGQIVALRPVKVISADYALEEYGITPSEMRNVSTKLNVKARAQIKTGKSNAYSGNIEDLIAD